MVINLDKIRALSSQMMTAVGSLEELGSMPYELLLKDKHKIASVIMREGKKKILCKSVQSMATLCGLRELRGIKIGLT